MTIRFHLSPEDVVETRFAFSAIWEIVASYRSVLQPARHVFHLPWIKQNRDRLMELDLEPLHALTAASDYMPDFLTPPPETPYPDVDEELARVAATPPALIEREVRAVYPDESTMPRAAREFIEHPAAAVVRLKNVLREYWALGIEEHWPRLQALLEGDVLYRARRLALEGAGGLFADLHPSLSWDGEVLTYRKQYEADVYPQGRGLMLIPLVFSCPGAMAMIDEPWQPTITYTPRGIANLWEPDERPSQGVMKELLGDTRAAILRTLEIPMTTTEVATKLGVTPGAVSQQLSLLKRSGVVEAHRSGRGVYSRRTRLGEQLLELLT